ncbi:MAG: polysaccharide deacetylase family protein [Candidatus Omnitrophica bacterium]|nr:polysaccharide deacetylase family protein [Candidatus Omnitrophota bacterium]
MKKVVKIILLGIAVLFISVCGFFIWVWDQYTVPVLMYHNVEVLDHQAPNWVSPEEFDWQMSFLRKHHYNVITLTELVDRIKAGSKMPHNTVAITFDDGNYNNYQYAYPILKKYKIPATIFLIASAFENKSFLSESNIREMAKNGIAFGSHTVSHAYLLDFDIAGQRREIFESKKIIEERLGAPINFLAYPIGGFSDPIKRMTQEAGFKAAFATNRGSDRFNHDVYELKRIRLSSRDHTPVEMVVKLSGYYNYFRMLKNPN